MKIFNQDDIDAWNEFLDEFDAEVYPRVFEHREYSKDAALLARLTNKVNNTLFDVNEPPEEPWEREW